MKEVAERQRSYLQMQLNGFAGKREKEMRAELEFLNYALSDDGLKCPVKSVVWHGFLFGFDQFFTDLWNMETVQHDIASIRCVFDGDVEFHKMLEKRLEDISFAFGGSSEFHFLLQKKFGKGDSVDVTLFSLLVLNKRVKDLRSIAPAFRRNNVEGTTQFKLVWTRLLEACFSQSRNRLISEVFNEIFSTGCFGAALTCINYTVRQNLSLPLGFHSPEPSCLKYFVSFTVD